MKFCTSLLLLFPLLAWVSSCQGLSDSPQYVFDTIGLNGNKIPINFHQHFKEIRLRKSKGILTIVTRENQVVKNATCMEFMTYAYHKTFDEAIEKTKNIRPSEENKVIVSDALRLFKYADDIYKTDFPRIAKMIDAGKSEEEIDAAIDELQGSKGVEIKAQYANVMDSLFAYADENGVEYETIKMP